MRDQREILLWEKLLYIYRLVGNNGKKTYDIPERGEF